jgi:hypothetical protein
MERDLSCEAIRSTLGTESTAGCGSGDKSAGRQALTSVDRLFLTDAAFMLRLHPKPADADEPIV